MSLDKKDRVIVEILSRSNKKELASLNFLLGKYTPYIPVLREGFDFNLLRRDMREDYRKISILGKKYYGGILDKVWHEFRADRFRSTAGISLRSSWRIMPKSVSRDNKRMYNFKSGGSNRSSMRYPSLKRSKATWRRFYELFPDAERRKEV